MKRTGDLALGLAAALAALAVAAAASASGRTRIVPPGADPRLLAAVTKANTEFETAITKGDVAAIVAPYAKDGVFVGVDGSCFVGRNAIERLYRDRFAKAGRPVSSTIESDELMLDGDVAFERGRGALVYRKEGKTSTSRARFLTVWRRQPGGGWEIARNLVLPPEKTP